MIIDDPEVTLSSGIEGLDNILRGGFPQGCLFLITGLPGTGKTSLAIQFLLEGVRQGERCLYITLSETKQEITKVARSHGWDLSRLAIAELIPSESNLSADAQLTVFNPSETELGETTEALIAAVSEHRPQRLVIDSLSDDVVLDDLGTRQLKNLARPERVFELRLETGVGDARALTADPPFERPDPRP